MGAMVPHQDDVTEVTTDGPSNAGRSVTTARDSTRRAPSRRHVRRVDVPVPCRVPVRELVVFLAVTFAGVSAVGVAWGMLGDIHDAGDQLRFGGVAMFTPAVGMLAAAASSGQLRSPRDFLELTGLVPHRPLRRLAGHLLLGIAIPLGIVATALALAVALGRFQLHQPFPVAGLMSAMAIGLVSLVPATVLVLGEELGWGYLLPRLLPLGLWPGMLAAGLLWGLFHAPLTMQGYGYPGLNGLRATVMFTTAHVLLGIIMAWIRLSSNSIWPAVALHGSSNMIANQIPAAVGTTDPTPGFTVLVPTSWLTWLAMLALIAAIAAVGGFRRLSLIPFHPRSDPPRSL
ncbi:CPBP family intramembrane glutamic endopeptidase [Tsukamurella tyrosinosolvens]|uniref:CPBP family intramembrane glutamic endopeptidase n=1 Tax=Tsukamurella tyrosinosolvens TaxID=57704 RepID=UPI000C7F104E|nr:CPBP family intramembrane glutamic endopeptidase [Tsukamurella tyrosinosolvens]